MTLGDADHNTSTETYKYPSASAACMSHDTHTVFFSNLYVYVCWCIHIYVFIYLSNNAGSIFHSKSQSIMFQCAASLFGERVKEWRLPLRTG